LFIIIFVAKTFFEIGTKDYRLISFGGPVNFTLRGIGKESQA